MNKASGGDGIPAELLQILKHDVVKVLHSICQQIWKTQQWPQDWKWSLFIPIPKKAQRIFKLPHNCTHFTCQQGNAQIPSNQASAVCELRTSRCTSWILKWQRNQRSYCKHPLDYRKSKRIPENICFIDYTKAFDCVDHNRLENSRDGNPRPPYVPPESCIQVKKQQLELAME